MRSTNFPPLDLSDYEISSEQGFLPQDPLGHLPDSPTLNDLGHELPKLLSARTVRLFIDEQRQLLPSIPPTWRTEDYRAAMRILSFAGHAYVWEVPDQPVATLPPQLAQPWYEVAQRLGRPPVLSYASYALDNWRQLDQTKPIQLDNIELLQDFLGGLDEEWFVVVHIQIEREAGSGLAGLLRGMRGAAEDKEGEALLGLESFAGQPQQFRGETGAQSSIVPCLDAGLGIAHAPDPLTLYLQEMRDYMPPRHRAFLQVLEKATDDLGRPLFAGYVRDRKFHTPDLWTAYCACVDLLVQFRTIHIDYADSYIHRQQQAHASNPTAVGTGGTPFMQYLQKHLDETKQAIAP